MFFSFFLFKSFYSLDEFKIKEKYKNKRLNQNNITK